MNSTPLAHARCQAANDCSTVDAIDVASSMPLRGRLDISARSVVVTARLGSTMVLQRIPFNSYTGVTARLDEQAGAPTVRLVLLHDDPAYCIDLDQNLELEEAVAVWRTRADALSVPMLIGTIDGQDDMVRPMLGPVHLGASQPHRKGTTLSRRPRFSKRRGRR